jgi:hypothetical protein
MSLSGTLFSSRASKSKYIELIAIDFVLENLLKCGWACKVNKLGDIGFDIIIEKENIQRTIEVKGRGVFHYSGEVNNSEVQRTNDNRKYLFSLKQVETADYFICVSVAPNDKVAWIIPKEDFYLLKSRKKPTSKENNNETLIFKRSRIVTKKDGVKIDLAKYRTPQGWTLIK